MGMRASRLARYPKSGDGASKSFLDKFEEIKKELTKRVRGTDSSRMLDPEIYRPTPKYGELQMPASMGPLNNTDETDKSKNLICFFKYTQKYQKDQNHIIAKCTNHLRMFSKSSTQQNLYFFQKV